MTRHLYRCKCGWHGPESELDVQDGGICDGLPACPVCDRMDFTPTERRPFRCRCFGCQYDDISVCVHCGTAIYDWPPHEDGWFWPLWWRVCRPFRWLGGLIIGKRCQQCKRRFWRGYDGYCCSDECFSKWIPF